MSHRIRPLVLFALALILLAATASQAAAVSVRYPTQSQGNRGTDVKAIQLLLVAKGYSTNQDGVFGPATKAAVIAFQTAASLKPTGIVDGATWTALVPWLQEGARGPAVMALQRLLIEKRRAAIAVDGVFGASTRKAVIAFQKHVGLDATGAVGRATWRWLTWHYEAPHFNPRTLCDYSVGNGAANWGTGAAIAQLEAAARIVSAAGHGRVAVGDVGREHGGNIALHETHEQGLDVDIRLMRRAEDQCRWGTTWRWSTYDRAATRALIKAIRKTAPGHVKLIYFNDPVLIREGIVRAYPGHDDHLHVRYCEKVHTVATYDC